MTRIHLIGVCGTAMATLAAMLKAKGHDVRGSDQNVYPPMSDFLVQQGITLLEGYRAEHISSDIDLVVIGNAISRGNPELEEVLDRKIRYCSMPEAIRDHFLWASRSVVVAGTHGKTTTTSLLGWLLTHGGADPSVLVGGIVENFEGSYRLGGGRDFIIEGDEYDSAFFDKTAKFLKYLPDVAIVSNIEFDHADVYPDLAAIRLAFQRFVTLIPRRGLLVLGADNAEALALGERARCHVETFGLSDTADWQAHDLRIAETSTTFGVRRSRRPVATFEVPLLGAYNVRNALAAIAVGSHLGLDSDAMVAGLRRFKGVRRRMQLRGTVGDVSVYDDFAHHPTAIRETLAGIKMGYPSRQLWAIFEPRSATSRRRVFQDAFVEAFDLADRVILAKPFASDKLPDAERLDAARLVADLGRRGVHAALLPTADDIVRTIAPQLAPGDLVCVMSSGGFDGIHGKLLAAVASLAPAA